MWNGGNVFNDFFEKALIKKVVLVGSVFYHLRLGFLVFMGKIESKG